MLRNDQTERGHAALLREAAAGRLSRRAALKRGLALGLGAPALAGVLLAARQDRAVAQTGEVVMCSSSDIFDCRRDCDRRLVRCRQTYGDSFCNPAYQRCLSGCDACNLPSDIA